MNILAGYRDVNNIDVETPYIIIHKERYICNYVLFLSQTRLNFSISHVALTPGTTFRSIESHI